DGGDGTLDAALAAGYERVELKVSGPTGEPVQAAIALRGGTAIVEMAQASGMQRLPGGRPAPLTASTFGTGELVQAALDRGAREVVLGIGGSATTDGGSGMARALGARFLAADGTELPPGGAALAELSRIDIEKLDPRLASVRVTVAIDVNNPLFGRDGAAYIYGPQKGATPEDVRVLDEALRRYAEVLTRTLRVDVSAVPGAGAAGGLGAGAMAFLQATPRSGISLMLDLVGFREALEGASLVVTGEGSLDLQSLRGKAVMGVTRAAAEAGVPVVVLAGRVELSPDEASQAGFAATYALADLEPDLGRSSRDAAMLLQQLAAGIVWPEIP
ncbi:MAG TPA: glycerate kinase, partial [Candidatus Dormibacteraeota bacterium]|nr:glycerate kinase [Candidatus Dormibacteraeota bacterium]